ncbi:MAG: CPBP family intramembrane metalloprotease [Bacteroidales bacterium]|nr:CPBP family intramembrane metalloprotease [Bacteroidales bacterium]
MSRKVQNYNLFADFAFYTPGVGGMFMLLALLLCGVGVGSLIAALLMPILGMAVGTLISYVLMFIPPMFYALSQSHRNSMWGEGVALSSFHVKPLTGLLVALLVSVATISAAFMTDLISSLMPEMPQSLKDALSVATDGNIVLNLLTVSVFAPLCEEWLCRGEVLRGLLNHKREDGSTMKPVWAIVISAAFFAVIHMNPWQAIPAFILGCLFGYVYYKTGSLWLTMLMHCVNNTLAVIVSHVDSMKDYDSWVELFGMSRYMVAFVVAALMLGAFFFLFQRIKVLRPEGNSDRILSETAAE